MPKKAVSRIKTILPVPGEPLKFPMTGYDEDAGVTQSILQSWCSCRCRCWLKLSGWRQDIGEPIMFGTLFHALLERYHREGGPVWSRAKLQELVEEVTASHYERWVVKELRPADKVEKIIGNGVALFLGYAERYRNDDRQKTWIEVEDVFDVEWQGFRLRGKIDGVFRAKDKTVWILETKTKSMINPERLAVDLSFDFQNLFYLTCFEAKTGIAPAGVLYNIARTPQLRQKTSESVNDYHQRVESDVLDRPEEYFIRYPITYTQERLRLFQKQLSAKLHEFKAWLRGELITYRNESCCSTWGYACGYNDVCANERIGANVLKIDTAFPELEMEEP